MDDAQGSLNQRAPNRFAAAPWFDADRSPIVQNYWELEREKERASERGGRRRKEERLTSTRIREQRGGKREKGINFQ